MISREYQCATKRQHGLHLAISHRFRLDIVKSWFDLVDEDGWVAREQILGAEARSKVGEIVTKGSSIRCIESDR
jgi:hypothetical protein